jgi:hypothetical protein
MESQQTIIIISGPAISYHKKHGYISGAKVKSACRPHPVSCIIVSVFDKVDGRMKIITPTIVYSRVSGCGYGSKVSYRSPAHKIILPGASVADSSISVGGEPSYKLIASTTNTSWCLLRLYFAVIQKQRTQTNQAT